MEYQETSTAGRVEGKPLKSILQSPYAAANDPDKQAIRIKFNLSPQQEWIADNRPYRSTYPEMKRRRDERKRLYREAMKSAVTNGDAKGEQGDGGKKTKDEEEEEEADAKEMNSKEKEEKGDVLFNQMTFLLEEMEEDDYEEDVLDYVKTATCKFELDDEEWDDDVEEEEDHVKEKEEEDVEEEKGEDQVSPSSSSPKEAEENGDFVYDPFFENFMKRWGDIIKLEIRWEGSGKLLGGK